MPILEDKKNYLKTSEVNTGDQVKFVDEGRWVVSKKFTNPDGTPRNQFEIGVEFNMEERVVTLNSTSRNALKEAYGKDTSKWISKKGHISVMDVLIGGKKAKSMLIEPIIEQ
jgi:hypothetical protein